MKYLLFFLAFTFLFIFMILWFIAYNIVTLIWSFKFTSTERACYPIEYLFSLPQRIKNKWTHRNWDDIIAITFLVFILFIITYALIKT